MSTDTINHPAHYQTRDGIEAIDVIEAMIGIEGHAANAIKYILRHKAKGKPAEDLGKARWYVTRLLAATGRLSPREPLDDQSCARVCDAFGLTGDTLAAFTVLAMALAATAEDRHRAHLFSVVQHLTREIDRLERAR